MKNKSKTNSKGDFFMSADWQIKRKQIKERDRYICQVCIRGLHGTINKFTGDGITVYHAESIADAPDKKLSDNNLLTICDMHKRMAISEQIPLEDIQKIIAEQNGTDVPCDGETVC